MDVWQKCIIEQEDEVERCTFCKLVFHKQCLKRLGKCPCQAQLGAHDESWDSSKMELSSGPLNLLRSRSQSIRSAGFLSPLVPRASSDRTKDSREDDTVILMDSLPSTSFWLATGTLLVLLLLSWIEELELAHTARVKFAVGYLGLCLWDRFVTPDFIWSSTLTIVIKYK